MRTLVCAWREDGNLNYWGLEEFNNFYLYCAAQAFKAEADRRHFKPITESRRVGYAFSPSPNADPILLGPDDTIIVVTLDKDRDPMTFDYSLGEPVGANALWMLASYLAQPHQMGLAQQHMIAHQKMQADAQLTAAILKGTKPGGN